MFLVLEEETKMCVWSVHFSESWGRNPGKKESKCGERRGGANHVSPDLDPATPLVFFPYLPILSSLQVSPAVKSISNMDKITGIFRGDSVGSQDSPTEEQGFANQVITNIGVRQQMIDCFKSNSVTGCLNIELGNKNQRIRHLFRAWIHPVHYRIGIDSAAKGSIDLCLILHRWKLTVNGKHDVLDGSMGTAQEDV